MTGTTISSTVFNALTADLATGLSTAITKDGQTATTVRVPFIMGINSSLATDSTNTTSGSIITAGGVGIAKAVFIGTTLNVTGVATLGNGAVLGTPASMTATNITGTASGLTAGTATTATGANALYSATTTVNVAAAAAPTNGQVLMATGASAATWQTPAAAAAAANQTEMEAASSNTVFATPSNLKWFPAIPKVYCIVDQSSGTAALSGMNFGVSSVSDGATGVFTINFNTNFSATTYGVHGVNSSNGNAGIYATTRNVGSVVLFVENVATGLGRDLDNNVIAIWGDQ